MLQALLKLFGLAKDKEPTPIIKPLVLAPEQTPPAAEKPATKSVTKPGRPPKTGKPSSASKSKSKSKKK